MIAVTRSSLCNQPRSLPGPLSAGFDPRSPPFFVTTSTGLWPYSPLMMKRNCQAGQSNCRAAVARYMKREDKDKESKMVSRVLTALEIPKRQLSTPMGHRASSSTLLLVTSVLEAIWREQREKSRLRKKLRGKSFSGRSRQCAGFAPSTRRGGVTIEHGESSVVGRAVTDEGGRTERVGKRDRGRNTCSSFCPRISPARAVVSGTPPQWRQKLSKMDKQPREVIWERGPDTKWRECQKCDPGDYPENLGAEQHRRPTVNTSSRKENTCTGAHCGQQRCSVQADVRPRIYGSSVNPPQALILPGLSLSSPAVSRRLTYDLQASPALPRSGLTGSTCPAVRLSQARGSGKLSRLTQQIWNLVKLDDFHQE
ncbi:hypothetical protein Bbelb_212370 [Branchiostoma belcheri]|nr:hypothetical protein Bbelb_212370 [Branchiostoma belcheri]